MTELQSPAGDCTEHRARGRRGDGRDRDRRRLLRGRWGGCSRLAFLLCAFWLSRRVSVWPVVALAVLFLFEIIYLLDYDWGVTGDRAMIVATLVASGVGLLGAAAWFVQRRMITA